MQEEAPHADRAGVMPDLNTMNDQSHDLLSTSDHHVFNNPVNENAKPALMAQVCNQELRCEPTPMPRGSGREPGRAPHGRVAISDRNAP